MNLKNGQTMETKQTALMWIELKLNSVKPTDFCSIETIKDWVNQAKAMEKKQIKDAYNFGYLDYTINMNENAEQYYNETYGKQ